MVENILPRTRGNAEELARQVVDLTTEFALELDDVGWAWAGSRWQELVASMLATAAEEQDLAVDPITCADALAALHLADVTILAADDPVAEAVPAVLTAAGFPEPVAVQLVAELRRAARHLAAAHDGRLQRLVRMHGEALVRDLAADLGLTSAFADAALRRWVQSTMNLPVPQRGRLVETARAAIGVTEAELVDICDAEELNVVVVDEAMRLQAMAGVTIVVDDEG